MQVGFIKEESAVGVKRMHPRTWVLGAGTAALLLCGTALTASAAPHQNFAARHAAYATTEANLLQKAQAGTGSSTTATAYSTKVQTINTQIAALFTSEQALAAAKASIPSRNPGEKAKLQAQKRTLTHEITDARAKLKKDRKNSSAAHELTLKVKAWTAQLRTVNFGLTHPLVAFGMWKIHPYAGGLVALQTSILDLQQAAIHYTQLWIAAETAASTTPTTGSAATITGLAYAVSSITVPPAGSAAVVDAVSVAPVVKNAQGNVLPDSGTYTIAGPTGATGVAIDAASGQVTVNAGATVGTYVVTYAQAGVSESVNLTVAQ